MELAQIFLLVFLILLILILISFVFSIFIACLSGAPFVKTSDQKLKLMLDLAKIKKGQKVLDLGSGDGKVVIALAKRGACAYGFEINPFLVLLSIWNIKRQGLESKAKIYWKSFWNVDLSSFEVVTIYGVDWIMEGLEKKLKRELKKGSRVVSNYFVFPNWKPYLKRNNVILYIKSK